MDRKSAIEIIDNFHSNKGPTEEDKVLYIEALEYLINEHRDSFAMAELGSYYYETRQFDLALKYYELASMNGVWGVDNCLGYIWYYGRTGTVDYEKAFHYFSKCMDRGDAIAAYKVADMYKNGYFVEKDYDKYVEIIDDLYDKARNNFGDKLPEIYLRYANIHIDDEDAALDALIEARYMIANRIIRNGFFGDISNMRWCMEMITQVAKINYAEFDYFDLTEVFKTPFERTVIKDDEEALADCSKVSFAYKDEIYYIEAFEEDDGNISVKFQDKWYRSVTEFMMNAKLDNILLCQLANRLEDWEVVWKT